jgi:hypothetical protein
MLHRRKVTKLSDDLQSHSMISLAIAECSSGVPSKDLWKRIMFSGFTASLPPTIFPLHFTFPRQRAKRLVLDESPGLGLRDRLAFFIVLEDLF